MASSGAHTLKAFDEDLEELRAEIAALGGYAEAATRDAVAALLRQDPDLAEEALARATTIPSLAAAVERRGLCLIALRAPRADDLQAILSALKIAALIERMAGQAKGIAAAVPAIDPDCPIVCPRAFGALARVATDAVRLALDAFACSGDAVELVDRAALDAERLYATLLQACLDEMRCHPRRIASAISFLFVARSLGRIAGQAGSVAAAVRATLTDARSAPNWVRENADLMECF
jgi:phosphate transport system protein